MARIDKEAFARGVPDVLTFRPLRRWIGWRFDRTLSALYVYRIFGPRCPEFVEDAPAVIAGRSMTTCSEENPSP